MEVFISWTKADEDVKNVLAKKLQDAGITCWDSDEQCTSDFAAECIAAIKRCSVFIALISDASMSVGYVQNEVTTARNLEKEGKLNILVYKLTDSPYTDQFEFLLNHISFVTGNMVQRVSSVSGVSSIDTIVRRTQELLKKRRDGVPEKPFDVNAPELDGLKLTKPAYFVDGSRNATLQAMEEGLSRSNVLILSEFFGFGKKSIIRKFTEQNRERYSTAVIVHNTCRSLREFFTVGLSFTNINENVFSGLQGNALLQAKLKFLEKLDERTLLVIPDVQLELHSDDELCEMLAALKCHIILLTQDSADGYADWFPVIPVGRMADEHLYTLFFHHYDRAYEEEKEALTEPLAQFFASIGGHTKTVELTAATLNRDLRVMPEDVPKYLSMQGGEGMALKDRILQQLETLFDAEQLAPESLLALLVAAYIAVPYISEKNYRSVLKICGVDDWQVVMELDKLRWLDVDDHNRTVSMEPVVAQVLFDKLPGLYPVMLACLEYLIEHYRKTAALSIGQKKNLFTISKLSYFLNATGYPECAAILNQLLRHELEDDQYDPQKMQDVLDAFEQQHPIRMIEGLFASAEEDQEDEATEETETPEDEATEETEEPENPIWTKEFFETSVLHFVRGTLPMAKLITKRTENLLFDTSSMGNMILRNEDFAPDIDIPQAFGLTREDFDQLLASCREEMQYLDENDTDSASFNMIMECSSVINSLYVRDYVSMQAGLYNIMEMLTNLPAALFDASAFDLVFIVFQAVCKIYIVSGTLPPIITFCERLLQFPIPERNRLTVLHFCILASRRLAQYTPELYSRYDELLKLYDKAAQDVLELRTDMMQEKKELLLMYAEDLALGEEVDSAMLQFVAATNLHVPSLLDSEANCAHAIVEVLIKTGDFQRAIGFINQYFTPQLREILVAHGNGNTQKILEEVTIYQAASEAEDNEFTGHTDPRMYLNYYQEFSRKNNGLLEQKYYNIADEALDYDFSDLTLEEITQHSETLRKRAKKEKMLRLAPEAFALASEAGFRVLGYRHHMVQYMGAAAMAEGKISEILNGEGKTYTILLTAFLHSLYGKRVYVIDQSDFLTARNYQWMRGVYALLGISCGHVTASGELAKAKENVIYTHLRTLLFGFLDYELSTTTKRTDLPLHTVIIDEADTTLVDEASQSFSLAKSASSDKQLKLVRQVWRFVSQLEEDENYFKLQRHRVLLQPGLYPLLEEHFQISYANLGQLDSIREIETCITDAIWCHVYAELNRDYFIKNDIPWMEDKKLGTFRRFSPQTEYFLCCENELDTRQAEALLQKKQIIINSITLRDFFNRFDCVCGATATAVSFREEFHKIYGLDYFCVPPHSPIQRQDLQSPLYVSTRAKEQAIMTLVEATAAKRQPILIVTQSTEESERYSKLLKRRGITHKLLNAKNAEAFADMMVWAGVSGSVLVTNALAGRGADIKLGGNPELLTRQELVEMGEDISALDSFVYRLPTPEQRSSPLFQKYHSILEKNKAVCAADRQAVINAGGLCVIGTGFFPEPRTEQQTRGRSGRQGDVGESWVFRSIEDEGLKPLLSAPMMLWMRENLLTNNNIDQIDSPLLQKSIKNAQQQLHRRYFAQIRNVNDRDKHIDDAREAFIGRRFALTDGMITVEAHLQEWTRDKTVLQQLQLLQKGETSRIEVLNKLYAKYPELKNARGFKTSSVLFDVINREIAENMRDENYGEDPNVIRFLCDRIMSAWQTFINTVMDTVNRVDTTEQSLNQFLLGERQRLLRLSVEKMINATKKKT
ncbi:MAG: TIR domain-containing protein [Oscillospiraceae bacterium]|nr:TIR domain-containing protein [Oscillospiraceae bacterium]